MIVSPSLDEVLAHKGPETHIALSTSLIADGLIEQSPDPADPRRTAYRLAGSAAEIRGAALETLAQLELVLAGRIGPRTLQSLRGALGKDWGEAIADRKALESELDGHKLLANTGS